MNNLPIYVDQMGALAIIALLSTAYGSIWRRFGNQTLASITLGSLFGIVAVMQMHAPLEISTGLILDMRNIPIALAGAFLGFRGLMVCLVIALSARYSIGGVGWLPGTIGMIIAGYAGYFWSEYTKGFEQRNLKALLCLAIAMSSHIFGALWFPWDTMVWFLTHVAPFMIGLNLIVIPIVGSLLDRENRLIESEKDLQTSTRIEPNTRMLQQSAFLQEMSHRKAAASPKDVSGVMILTIRRRKQFISLLGQESLDTVLGAIRIRLSDLMIHGDCAGITNDGRILVALSADEMRAGESWQVILCRTIRDTPITLPGCLPIRVMLSHEILATTDVQIIQSHLENEDTKTPTFEEEILVDSKTSTMMPAVAQPALPNTALPPIHEMMPSLNGDLFAKANLLMVRS